MTHSALAAAVVPLDELTDADLAVAGRAHHVLGLALAHSDLAIDALAAMELGCDELLQAGERQSLGRLVRDLANLRGNQFGQTAEALEGYEVALSIANEVGSTADQGSVLNGMGVLFGRLERWDESERALRRVVSNCSAPAMWVPSSAALSTTSATCWGSAAGTRKRALFSAMRCSSSTRRVIRAR